MKKNRMTRTGEMHRPELVRNLERGEMSGAGGEKHPPQASDAGIRSLSSYRGNLVVTACGGQSSCFGPYQSGKSARTLKGDIQ